MKSLPHTEFSPEFEKKLYDDISKQLKGNGQDYAVFDADGTLWDCDLGESFFQYQIDKELVNIPKNPWKYYNSLKDQSAPQAYFWLAEINQGVNIDSMRSWAEACVKNLEPIPFFSSVTKLIQQLQEWNVNVYIVTASIKWAVEPGAKRLGIPFENVIGIQTEIDNGLITNRQKGPITYREGKAKAFFHESQGIAPILAAGNTMGDYHLIDSSSGVKLCIQSASSKELNYDTETELKEHAIKNAWYHHKFR